VSTRTVPPESPYKGLRPFEATAVDAQLFFGRERERELIAANLTAARLTVLYGESGVGKSSVLRAGVVHPLRQQAREGAGFAVALYSTWSDEDPIEGIAEAAREAVEDVLGRDPGAADGTLAERLRVWSDLVAGEIYLVLDQVDEYFLYHGTDGGPLLKELPLLVTEPGLPVNVVLGIREDALARLDVFKARIPSLFGNYLRLERLGREAARDAIVGPLQQWSRLAGGEPVTIESTLVDTILDEVAVGRIGGNGATHRRRASRPGAVGAGAGGTRHGGGDVYPSRHAVWREGGARCGRPCRVCARRRGSCPRRDGKLGRGAHPAAGRRAGGRRFSRRGLP
jgi:hypothetical protein